MRVKYAASLEGGEKGETSPQPQKPRVGPHEPLSIHPHSSAEKVQRATGELQAFTGRNNPHVALALLSPTEVRHKFSKEHLRHTQGLQRRQRGWEEEQPPSFTAHDPPHLINNY